MSKMFFSQKILDALVDEGKIRLDHNILTLLAKNKQSFELEPAFRFISTADNGLDPHKLIGQVKYEKALKAMNAEIYLDSVIYQETAYNVEPGYIGEKKELMDSLSDTDILARFLLENLI
jgi:hypothetical protein